MIFNLLMATTFALGCNAVFVIPRDFFISTPGGSAEFRCIVEQPTILGIQWIVNGSLLENLRLTGVTTEISMRFGIGVLIFENLPMEYNETTIRCRARFFTSSGGQDTSTSPGATLLLLQGLLTAVGSLSLTVQDSMAFLNWTAPFRLRNPDNTPEVAYCVEVINGSSSEEPVLVSQCGISETRFSFTIPPQSWCYLYVAIVTPINTVGRGVQGALSYFGTETSPHLVKLSRVSAAATSDVLTYSLIMAAPVCMIELTLLDMNVIVQGATAVLRGNDQDVDIMENNITFTTEQLTTNRLYHLTITARNIAGRSTVVRALSTHDVKNASIDRQGVKVTTLYYEHSTASGALFSGIFITDNGDVDFSRSFLLALDRNTSHSHILPFDLSTGRYVIHVYDIEYDGTLFESYIGYPAVTDDRTIGGNGQGESFQTEYIYLENCQLTGSTEYISVQCSYPSNSVATGFQVVAQMSNLTEVHKLYTGKTSENSVTVQVGENGEYQVSVFAIRGRMGILNSNIEYRGQISVMELTASMEITEHTTFRNGLGVSKEGSSDVALIAGVSVAACVVFIAIVIFLVVIIFRVRRKLTARFSVKKAASPSPSTIRSNALKKSDPVQRRRHQSNEGIPLLKSSDVLHQAANTMPYAEMSDKGASVQKKMSVNGEEHASPEKTTDDPAPDETTTAPGGTTATAPGGTTNIIAPGGTTNITPEGTTTKTPSYASTAGISDSTFIFNGPNTVSLGPNTAAESLSEHEYYKNIDSQQAVEQETCARSPPRSAHFRNASNDNSSADDMDQLPPGQSTFHSNASVTEEGDTFPKEETGGE